MSSTHSHNSLYTLTQTVNSSKPTTKFSLFMLLPFYGDESERVGGKDVRIVGCGCVAGHQPVFWLLFRLPVCASLLVEQGASSTVFTLHFLRSYWESWMIFSRKRYVVCLSASPLRRRLLRIGRDMMFTHALSLSLFLVPCDGNRN